MSTARHLGVGLAASVFVVFALAGCSASRVQVITTPGPTVTDTTTTTATPAPTMGESPLTQAEAWDVCWGAQVAFQNKNEILNNDPENDDSVTSTWNAYSPALITPASGGFKVTLRAQSSSEEYLFCTVTGSAGRPFISDYQFQR
jgi:hypothetical protein